MDEDEIRSAFFAGWRTHEDSDWPKTQELSDEDLELEYQNWLDRTGRR